MFNNMQSTFEGPKTSYKKKEALDKVTPDTIPIGVTIGFCYYYSL